MRFMPAARLELRETSYAGGQRRQGDGRVLFIGFSAAETSCQPVSQRAVLRRDSRLGCSRSIIAKFSFLTLPVFVFFFLLSFPA